MKRGLLYHLLLAFSLISVSAQTVAVQCEVIYPQPAQSPSNSGRLTIWSGGSIRNATPPTLPFVAQSPNNMSRGSCPGFAQDRCRVSGSPSPTRDNFSFRLGSGDSINHWDGSVRTVADDGVTGFGQVQVNSGTLIFAPPTERDITINSLEINNGAVLRLAPGSYWVEQDFRLNNGTVTIEGNGTVRLFVRGTAVVNGGSTINQNGSAERFLLYAAGHVALNQGALTAAIYADQSFSAYNHSTVNGAVVAAEVTLSPGHIVGQSVGQGNFYPLCGEAALLPPVTPQCPVDSPLTTGVTWSTFDAQGWSTTRSPENADAFQQLIDGFANDTTLQGRSIIAAVNLGGRDINPHSSQQDYYLSVLNGYLDVPEDGTYQFALDGDDAVEVWIDDINVTGWYSPHSAAGSPQYAASIGLERGYHKLEFRHHERTGDEHFYLYWRVPSSATLVKVPDSAYHTCSLTPDNEPEYEFGRALLSGGSAVVSFSKNYRTTPLVFVNSSIEPDPTPLDDGPAVLRITEVTPTGFTVSQYQPPGNQQPSKPMASVDYFVMEAGQRDIGGLTFVAGTVTTAKFQGNNSAVQGPNSGIGQETVPLGMLGLNPAVLAQIQSQNNPLPQSYWLTAGIDNVEQNGDSFQLYLEASEAPAANIVAETVAWLAVESSTGVLDLDGALLPLEATRTTTMEGQTGGRSFEEQCQLSSQNFKQHQNSYANPPILIGKKNSRDSNNGGWLRRCRLTETHVSFVVDEDQYQDSEREHVEEQLSYIAFEGPEVLRLLAFYRFEQDQSGLDNQVDDSSNRFNPGRSYGDVSSIFNGRYCRGVAIADGEAYLSGNLIGTPLNLTSQVGEQGTISFWYRSQQPWQGGGDRLLFDASDDALGNGFDKYFWLKLTDAGRLYLRFEDDRDADFDVLGAPLAFGPDDWVYITLSYDYAAGQFTLYVNANQYAYGDFSASLGAMPALGEASFGDTRADYSAVYAGTRTAAGRIDETRIYAGVQTPAEILADMNDSRGCALANYRLVLSTLPDALTCQAHPLTLSIYTDSGVLATNYEGVVTLNPAPAVNPGASLNAWATLNADGVLTQQAGGAAQYQFVQSDGGTAELSLRNIEQGSITINGQESVSAATATAAATYRANGFIASVPAYATAGVPFELLLRPVGMDEVTQECVPQQDYLGNKSLQLWADHQAPVRAAVAGEIAFNGQAIEIDAGEGAAATVPVEFLAQNGDVSGVVEVNYLDAGKIQLYAKDATGIGAPPGEPGSQILSGSATTVVNPARLALVDIQAATGEANPAGTANSGSRFVIAGAPFNAVVEALNANDQPTPSFRADTQLVANLHTPAGGRVGALSWSPAGSNAAAYQDGRLALSQMQYGEVGSMQLSVTARNFVNAGNDIVLVAADSPVIGRFYPKHLLLQHSSSANGNSSNPGCASFTYMDDAAIGLQFTLQALNDQDQVTENYDTALGYSVAESLLFAAEDNNAGVNYASRLAFGGGAPSLRWVNGVSDYTNSTVQFSRAADVDGPFNRLLLSMRVTPEAGGQPHDGVDIANRDVDPDSALACTPGVDCPYKQLGSLLDLRYGRLRGTNASGSELRALAVPLRAERWDGSRFVLEQDDSCTRLPASIFRWNDQTSASAIDLRGGSGQTDASYHSANLVAGDAQLQFSAPGEGQLGRVDILLELSSALPFLRYDYSGDGTVTDPPQFSASFGHFRGSDRVIYWREAR